MTANKTKMSDIFLCIRRQLLSQPAFYRKKILPLVLAHLLVSSHAQAGFLSRLLKKPDGPYKLALCQATLLNQDVSRGSSAHLSTLRDIKYRVANGAGIKISEAGKTYSKIAFFYNSDSTPKSLGGIQASEKIDSQMLSGLVAHLNQLESDTEKPTGPVKWVVGEIRGQKNILAVMAALKKDTLIYQDLIEKRGREARSHLKGKKYAAGALLTWAATALASAFMMSEPSSLDFSVMGITALMATFLAKLYTVDRTGARSVSFVDFFNHSERAIQSDSKNYLYVNSDFMSISRSTVEELFHNRDRSQNPRLDHIVSNTLFQELSLAELIEVRLKRSSQVNAVQSETTSSVSNKSDEAVDEQAQKETVQEGDLIESAQNKVVQEDDLTEGAQIETPRDDLTVSSQKETDQGDLVERSQKETDQGDLVERSRDISPSDRIYLVADHLIYFDDQANEPVWLVYHRIVDSNKINSTRKKPKKDEVEKEIEEPSFGWGPTPIRAGAR